MKRIYAAILAFAAALMFVPTASAQKDIPYHEKGGVGYNKYIVNDKPDEKGEYLVHLETFTTGEVHVDRKSIPSDIVLVLDMSGSMAYDYKRSTSSVPLANQIFQETGTAANDGLVIYRYSAARSTTNGYNNPGTADNISAFSDNYHRFIKYGDEYCRIRQESQKIQSTTYYALYFTPTGGTKKYLRGKSTDEDNGLKNTFDEARVTGTDKEIYRGNLYRYPSRVEYLRESVNKFIELIAKNDSTEVQPYLPTGVKGNQISIVQFSGNTTPATELPKSGGEVQEFTGTESVHVVKRFTEVDTRTKISALHTAMNGMKAKGNTPIECGVKLAELLLRDLEANGMPAINEFGTKARLKTVVVFTDGAPVNTGRSAEEIYVDATQFGYNIKNNWSGQIFSIGFNPSDENKTFLEYLSSEYKDGLRVPDGNKYKWEGTKDTEHLDEDNNTIYYKDAAVSDLSKVFESIAEYAGGNNQEYGATSMVAVDIVSTSFQLPVGVDTSRIKVYTAQCLGTLDETFTPEGESQAKNYLAFAEPKEAPTRGSLGHLWVSHKVWKLKPDGTPELDANGNKIQDVDEEGNPKYDWEPLTDVDIDGVNNPGPNNTNGIRLSIDTTDNSLSITGFDFAQCWCGLDAEHENTEDYTSSDPNYRYHKAGYRGFKLIIEFPIKITDDAVGGPNVNTNLPGSGLYMTDAEGNKTGEPIILYPQPNLPVPVNLWLQKKGLKKGESVTFTIERRDSSDPDSEYEYFTNVILTGKPGDAPVMEKLLNLDPKYYYRIKESGWSWAYSNQKDDQGVLLTEDGKVASTEVNTHNPIIIVNTPKDDTPKHAESVVNNSFLTHQAVTTSSKDHTYKTVPGSGTTNP